MKFVAAQRVAVATKGERELKAFNLFLVNECSVFKMITYKVQRGCVNEQEIVTSRR